MVISSIVQHHDDAPPRRVLAHQAPEESLEGGSVEDGAHHSHELSAVQADGAKAGHGFSGRCMPQDRVFDFGRYPHSATRTVLLEVTFIQTPQFDVGTTSQTTEFFLLPQLLADPIGQPGGGACVTESPSLEIVAGIAAHRDLLHTAGADVPTTPARPTEWPPSRNHVGSYAGLTVTYANPLDPMSAADPIARLRVAHRGRPLRNDSPSAAPSYRSRQRVPQPLGRIARRSPAAIRAAGGRSATPRYAQFPAGSQFALPQHPGSVACASSLSQRKGRSYDITMLHYLCRRV